MPLELPVASFDQIAVDLKLYADSASRAVGAGEVMIARGGWAGGMAHTITELEASARIAGQLYEFFRAAAPYEEVFRDFVAGLDDLSEKRRAS